MKIKLVDYKRLLDNESVKSHYERGLELDNNDNFGSSLNTWRLNHFNNSVTDENRGYWLGRLVANDYFKEE